MSREPDQPVIEVVIAAYNAENTISATLDSICAQSVPVRVRVEDDGSVDSTGCLVQMRNATQLIAYRRGENAGAPMIPRNRGLADVNTEYVVFFDADDLMSPGYLEHAIAILDENPSWVALISDYRNFSDLGPSPQTHFDTCRLLREFAGGVMPKVPFELPGDEARRLLIDENFVITGSMVCRTNVVKRIGGFDTSDLFGEDFDLCWRLSKQGPIGVTPFVAFNRRLHGRNLSSNFARAVKDTIVRRNNYLALEENGSLCPPLRRSIARAHGNLASELFRLGSWRGVTSLARSVLMAARYGGTPAIAYAELGKFLLRGPLRWSRSVR